MFSRFASFILSIASSFFSMPSYELVPISTAPQILPMSFPDLQSVDFSGLMSEPQQQYPMTMADIENSVPGPFDQTPGLGLSQLREALRDRNLEVAKLYEHLSHIRIDQAKMARQEATILHQNYAIEDRNRKLHMAKQEISTVQNHGIAASQQMDSEKKELERKCHGINVVKHQFMKEKQEVTAENEKLTNEEQLMTTEKQQMTTENEQLEAKNQELTTQNEELTSESQRIKKELEQLAASDQGLKEENRVLRNEQKQSLADNMRLKEQTQQLEGEKQQSLADILLLEVESVRLRAEINKMQDGLEESQTKCATLEALLPDVDRTYHSMMQLLNNDTTSQQLHLDSEMNFCQRVLYAVQNMWFRLENRQEVVRGDCQRRVTALQEVFGKDKPSPEATVTSEDGTFELTAEDTVTTLTTTSVQPMEAIDTSTIPTIPPKPVLAQTAKTPRTNEPDPSILEPCEILDLGDSPNPGATAPGKTFIKIPSFNKAPPATPSGGRSGREHPPSDPRHSSQTRSR
jgi:hypothetical protein